MSRTESEFDELHTDPEHIFSLESGGEDYEYSGSLPDETFKFRTEDFISRPFFSENCDIEENILEFDFSYGYDSKKPYNLVAVDEKTLIYASGNLIHFFDVDTREVWFRRSAFGGGIGHITKNPNPDYRHIAVGENGKNPPIIIYEWPSLEIMCLLKGGTSKKFTHLNYSPAGDLLVSQGGEPDYLITVFDWPKSTILLRCKSYVNDVYRVMFSPEVPGQIASCGVAHIKFWKMAHTFTGLKLQGELGRFGKTEFSDIIGIYQMPDEKVISGCFWGNILVWDEGLVHLEVCRKGKKKCHDDAIVQFDYKEGELWTVAMDGRVRLWYYDTIDQADPPSDNRVIEMEPTYDFYTPGASFMCICKQFPDPEDSFYFAQDARGGIWRIDLTTEREAEPSERLLQCHAGVAKALAACPWGPYFNTLGNGGRLHLYHYLERKLLVVVSFPAKGDCLLWMPMEFDHSGETELVGLGDGTIRVCVWKIDTRNPTESKLHTIQTTKPHTSSIKSMVFNKAGDVLVSGSEDCTIFVYQAVYPHNGYVELIPVGYIKTPDPVTYMIWHSREDYKIIVGCLRGQIMTVEVPREPVDYTTITYLLNVEPIHQKFTSYKSQIRRDIYLEEVAVKKEAKRALKQIELNKFKRDNPGLDVDEEVFLADSESEEKLDPLYIPEPNPILWLQHTEDDTLWVSMGGYDAGYIYEYKIGQTSEAPYRFTMVHDADDIEITRFLKNKSGDYLIFTMQDGSIRVNKTDPQNWRDLSNYWQLAMHDNYNGLVHGICFSFDENYVITCGNDGNIFTFRFYPEFTTDEDEPETIIRVVPDEALLKPIVAEDYTDKLSLEQTIVKAEQDRINKVANMNKAVYLQKLQVLREKFENILERNAQFPVSQQICVEDLLLDPRVEENLQEKLDQELALVKRKLAFGVEKARVRMIKLKEYFVDCMDMFPFSVQSVNSAEYVDFIKQPRLDPNHFEMAEEVERKILEEELKGRPPERPQFATTKLQFRPIEEPKLEYFLLGLSKEVIEQQLGPKVNRLLAKHRKRRKDKLIRNRDWEIFNSLKPSENPSDVEHEAIIHQAEETIGDFKLKTSSQYKVPKQLRETPLKKFKELLSVRKRQYDIAHNFNVNLYDIREQKRKLHDYLIEQTEALDRIHEEISQEEWLFGPSIFKFDDDDYPEKSLEVQVQDKHEEVAESTKNVRELTYDMLQMEVLQNLNAEEENEVETIWECEMRQDRYRSKLFEQSETIRLMEMAISNFNELIHIKRLNRISTITSWYFITAHLLTLNQELLILKDCEDKENNLTDRVNNKIIELMDTQDIATAITNKMDDKSKEVGKLQEREKEIQRTFFMAVSENKFYDFMRRIFKKKYKPPKTATDDDSDSSSSSSSSEEEEDDAASIDSKDFGIIRLDENVCPKGCDQNLYDLTFQLRDQRHTVELDIKEANHQIELLKKDLEGTNKKIRIVDAQLKLCQDELEKFQREKQQKLNKVLCVIVLTMEQYQNFYDDGTLAPVRESICISQKVLSRLYNRVGELKLETLEQKSKHKLSVTHLTRMKVDLKHMMTTIHKLKKQIMELMYTKFGGKVDINELEEFQLKKLIFDMRLSQIDFNKLFNQELERVYQEIKSKQRIVIKVFRKNTAKLELMRLMVKERDDLAKVINRQEYTRANIDNEVEEAQRLKNGVLKLNKVVREQNKEIEILKREILIFKTKGYTLPPPRQQLKAEEEVEEEAQEEQSVVSDWKYVDDYMYTEAYAETYWTNKQIRDVEKMKQDVIVSILDELFKNLRAQLNQNMITSVLKSVLSDIMNRCDVEQIIADILLAIPEPSVETQSIVEEAAEKLCSITDLEINLHLCSKEILVDMVDCILSRDIDDPNELVATVIQSLLQYLPLHCILDDENIDTVCERLKIARIDLTELDLVDKIGNYIKLQSLEARTVLSEILERATKEPDPPPPPPPEPKPCVCGDID